MGTEVKENFIYKAINYFYWIFMSNIIFMILNIPALFLLLVGAVFLVLKIKDII